MKSLRKYLDAIHEELVVQNMSEGLVIHGKDGRIVTHNNAALKILGLTEGQLSGRDALDPRWKSIRLDGTDFPVNEHPSELALHEKKRVKDVTMGVDDPKRGVRWLNINAVPAAQDDENLAIVSFCDITEQVNQKKQLEQELSKERFILDSTGVGVWDLDLTKNELRWDDSMYALYGVKRESFKGDYQAWKSTLHKDDWKTAPQALEDAIEGKKAFDTTFKIIHPKKGERVVRAKATVVRDSEGHPKRVMGVNLDVTEEVESRNELELQRKMASQVAKLASIGELAAGVGHEINNPLAIANGNVRKIKKELEKLNIKSDVIDQAFNNYQESSKRIGNIVKGLSSFAGSDSENISRIDFSDAVRSTINLVEEIYRKDGIQIEFNLPAYSVSIKGNVGRIQQLLMNLLTNARDATEGNKDRKIIITLTKAGKIGLLNVKDNGYGIPLSIQEKVFDNFFTTKKIGEGTGLGLTLCSRIAQEHNGEIELVSKEGHGASFTVRIPLARKVDKQQEQEAEQQQNFISSKVLIVDDEKGVREVLRDLLEEIGCEVDEATDGLEAIEKVKSNNYDNIFTDLKMPGMDGQTLVRELHSQNLLKNTKLFIITGGIDPSFDGDRFIDGKLFKPIDEEKIRKLLMEKPTDKEDSIVAA